jgi:hypothetical protein
MKRFLAILGALLSGAMSLGVFLAPNAAEAGMNMQ